MTFFWKKITHIRQAGKVAGHANVLNITAYHSSNYLAHLFELFKEKVSMKTPKKLPEQELSDLTVEDILSGDMSVNGLYMAEEEEAVEEDLILGDEDEMDGDEEEFEVELEEDMDADDVEEEDLVIGPDDDVEDLDGDDDDDDL